MIGTQRGTGKLSVSGLADRLGSTVLYQIYPQSFADSDGDGIGDLNGIRQRLDYLAWLGVDALWLNPCFVSPFADAGYDVADYFVIAARYGTNDDLAALCSEAADRGMAILLDLVAGHTSDQHPWFRAACRPEAPDRVRDRYIWSDRELGGWHAPIGVPDPGRRYLPNFFPVQPALNFGYARMNPEEPWRQSVNAPGPQANRDALREIMAHWFDLGVSGFRVDMAASLVKDDPGLVETGRLWTDLRQWLDAEYPGRVLVAEWGNPAVSVPFGFHADFFLHFGRDDYGLPWRSLFNNNAGTVDPVWRQETCWADADGRGDASGFVAAWADAAASIGTDDRPYGVSGIVGLPTANHDVTRLVAGPRDAVQAAVGMALVLTWPAMPSIYYGDELGQRYLTGICSKEGSRLGPTFERAGSRTPMQWGGAGGGGCGPGEPADSRYLPSDPSADAPTVADALADPDSLLHLTRRLIALRHTDPRLHASAPVQVLTTGCPFAFTRGADASLLVALNPSRELVTLDVPGGHGTVLAGRDISLAGPTARLGGFGFAIIDLTEGTVRCLRAAEVCSPRPT